MDGNAPGAVVAILLWGTAFSAIPTLLNAAALQTGGTPLLAALSAALVALFLPLTRRYVC